MTEEDLDSFEADYRGSEEETSELLQMYTRFKGNMDMVRTVDLLCLNATAEVTDVCICYVHYAPPLH